MDNGSMEHYEKKYTMLDLEVTKDIRDRFGKIITLVAGIFHVPAALIMKVRDNEIEVFSSSKTPGNPYSEGVTEKLKGKLYCETVMTSNQMLYVDNAMLHEKWKDSPDIPLHMISYLGFPIHWPDGEMFGTICVLDSKTIPLSEEKTTLLDGFREVLEDELQLMKNLDLERKKNQQRTQELETINREMEAFSYTIAHDLRSPLRAINSFTHLFLDEYSAQLSDKGRGYLDKVRNASLSMNQLINDLLSLDKIRETELTFEEFDLSQMVRNLLEERRQIESMREVELKVQDGVRLVGDKSLIHVVIENLLDNAWKFTSLQQVCKIEFGTQTIDSKTTYFIKDNGVGFNMDYSKKLFGNFQKLHSIINFPGTGIGLATIQKIIHKHGGVVWATGEEGKGACFYFTVGDLAVSS
jgi:signal transduction histidine kinase